MEDVVKSMRVRAEIAASGGAVGLAESAPARGGGEESVPHF